MIELRDRKPGKERREHEGAQGKDLPGAAGGREIPERKGSESVEPAGAQEGPVESVREDGGRKGKKKGLKARVEQLEDALERAEAESEENRDRWLRARAEYENLKKRTQRDLERIHKVAGERLVMGLLPVLDELEGAIEASRTAEELRPMEEGLSLIRKGLVDTLRSNGVEALDPLGERFDPNLHEAIMQAPADDAEPGTVIRVLQKGYVMNGMTLRAAKVIVAAAAEDSSQGQRESDEGQEAHRGES